MRYQVPSTGLHNLPQETGKNWISYGQTLMDSAHVRKLKVLRQIETVPAQGTHPSASVFCLPLCSGDAAVVQVVAGKKKKGLRCH